MREAARGTPVNAKSSQPSVEAWSRAYVLACLAFGLWEIFPERCLQTPTKGRHLAILTQLAAPSPKVNTPIASVIPKALLLTNIPTELPS